MQSLKNRSTPRDFANQTWHLSRWTRQTNFFSANEFLAPYPTILFSCAPISSPSPPISSPVLLRRRWRHTRLLGCPSVRRPMKEGRRVALNGQRPAWEGWQAALSSWRRSKRSVWRRQRGRGRCKTAARSGEAKGPRQPICGAKKSPTVREYVAATRNP